MSDRGHIAATLAPNSSRLAMPARLLQRKCACGVSAGFSGQCEDCGKKRIGAQRRAAGPAPGIAPPIVHEVLGSPGQPLDPATRAFMEPRFGHDFSRVRVHTDARAAQSADAVSAHAYTVGRDVVFAARRYAPETGAGRRLLAHELTHVVQQGTATNTAKTPVEVGASAGPHELEAREAAALAMKPSSKGHFSPALARFPTATLQRDLAIQPVHPDPIERGLSEEDINRAIRFNRQEFDDPYSLMVIRDVIGISKYPAVSDRDLALGVAAWQASHGIAEDGMLGPVTVTFVIEELQAEADNADAVLLMAEFPRGTFLDIDTSFCQCRQDLQDEITSANFFIGEYQACGNDPANTTGDQIEACIDRRAQASGTAIVTLGTTSASGQINVAQTPGPCGRLMDRITTAHEQIHSVHTRELQQTHGRGTPAFRRAFADAADWVQDEIHSRETDIAAAEWATGILDRICP